MNLNGLPCAVLNPKASIVVQHLPVVVVGIINLPEGPFSLRDWPGLSEVILGLEEDGQLCQGYPQGLMENAVYGQEEVVIPNCTVI